MKNQVLFVLFRLIYFFLNVAIVETVLEVVKNLLCLYPLTEYRIQSTPNKLDRYLFDVKLISFVYAGAIKWKG